MTTTTVSLPSGRRVTLTELPDPPKSPYAMQQRPHITRADQTLRAHYRHRADALVSGEGYLCYDASDLRRAPHPDCLVAQRVAEAREAQAQERIRRLLAKLRAESPPV